MEVFMATIKEIAEIVGVSSAAVSRVLNYDEGISVSAETRAAIFAAAEKVGYKKRIIFPKIENVALLYFTEAEDELEDIFYQNVKDELLKQARKMNIHLTVYSKKDGMDAIPKDLNAFVAVGWLNRKEINRLYRICKRGVFIGTSPDEKLFDAVRPNMDSFVTQIVDYFMEKGHRTIGFIGGPDRNIDTGLPSMDIREWSFRQSASTARPYPVMRPRFRPSSASSGFAFPLNSRITPPIPPSLYSRRTKLFSSGA